MKRIYTTLFALLLTLFDSSLYAQDSLSWDDFIDDYATDENEESTLSDTYETLTELHEHPLNINTATREELGQLPFLTDKQIEEIQAYIHSYGEMKTAGELLMIESLDYETRQKLMHFIYIGEVNKQQFPSIENILKYGKQEILASASIPFYNRKGDDNGYLGYKYGHSIRYSYRYGNYLKFGIVGAQGAGEPFFANKNKWGYDHYSYYFVINNMRHIKTLTLGCYRLSFGLGLVVNSNFSLGKIAELSSLGRINRGITAHSSQSESNYFKGVATTVEVAKNITMSGFLSYHRFDGTLNKDNTLATILTTGYHRTQNEMDKKDNCSSTDAGGNINIRYHDFHVGMTSIYTVLNRTLKPNTSAYYRMYYPAGKQFFNSSIDYGYLCRYFIFNGEIASGNCGGIATLNNLSVHINKNLDLMTLQRFYSYKYSSLYSNSFSEGGSIQNESGIYVGANWRPAYEWNIMAYTDWFYFAWPRYQISESSHGCDNLISMSYKGKKWGMEMRYRMKIRQKDNSSKTALDDHIQQRIRLRFNKKIDKHFESQTQFDGVGISTGNHHEYGYMINQNIGYSYTDRLSTNITYGYFHTDSYDSRVCIYERGLLYRFSFPSFYGKGTRLAVSFKGKISQKIMLIAKIGVTDYLDRDHISSGMQQINHSSQTDADIQMKWNF